MPPLSGVKSRKMKPLICKGKWIALWGLPAHPGAWGGGPRQLISLGWFLTWLGLEASTPLLSIPLLFPPPLPPALWEGDGWMCCGCWCLSLASGKSPSYSPWFAGTAWRQAGKRGGSQRQLANSCHLFSCFLINKPHSFFLYLPHICILDKKMRAAFYPHTTSGTFGIIHYEN